MSLAEIGLPSCKSPELQALHILDPFHHDTMSTDVGIDGGGARVDGNFRTYLETRLDTSPDFDDKEDIPDILSDGRRDFERRCKRTFTPPALPSTVNIGSRRMTIQALQITKGNLALDRYDATRVVQVTQQTYILLVPQ